MSQQDPNNPQGDAAAGNPAPGTDGNPNPYGQPISQPPPAGQYPPQQAPPAPGPAQYPPQQGQYPPQQYPPQVAGQVPPAPPLPPGQPPYGYPPQYAPPQPQPLSQSDERLWGMLAFLLSLVAGFLAPLIIYFVYRDRSRFVRTTSLEALNLQITAAIVYLVASIGLFGFGTVVTIVLPPAGFIMFIAWFVIIIGYAVAVLVFQIMGAMKANNGEAYRVPYILRLVK